MSRAPFTEEEVKAFCRALKIDLTTSRERSWYGDNWTETVTNWSSVTRLVNAAREAVPGRPFFVFHPDDPKLRLLPDGTHVVLQRKLPTSS